MGSSSLHTSRSDRTRTSPVGVGFGLFLTALAGPAAAQTWTQLSPSSSPSARRFHTMSYDEARDRVVLFGGMDTNILADTWEHDGTTWANVSPVVSPPPRRYHAMCYDSARGRTIVHGGDDGVAILTDTWEYDGTTWVRTAIAAAPTPRLNSVLAYDIARRRVVLFGGDDPTGRPLADTWEYDGTQWMASTPVVSPPARSRAAMVYDSARGTLVLHGGFDTQAVSGNVMGLPLGDTWTFDGTTWASVNTLPRPVDRALHTAVFDRTRGRMLVHSGAGPIVQGGHGGGSTTTMPRDTWAFDGSVWTQLATLGPSGRYAAAMAFDSRRGRALLFGGYDQTRLLADLWEWRPAPSASFTRHGLGCAGSTMPRLDATPGLLPSLGTPFSLALRDLPTLPGSTTLVFGTDLTRVGGTLLPFDLDPTRPHCFAWLAPLPGAAIGFSHTSSAVTVPLPIPNDLALRGLVLGVQALAADAGTPSGYGLSNGAVLWLQ